MKKLLLSCCIALGIGANAQETIFSDNFETSTTGTYGSWTSGFFGTATSIPAARNDFMVRTSAQCTDGSLDGSGNHMQIVRYAANVFSSCTYGSQTASYRPLIYRTIDASNYKNIKLSFDWICNGQAATDYGQVMIGPNESNSFYAITGTTLQGSSTKQHFEVDLTDLFDGEEQIDFTKINIGFAFMANNSTNNGPSFSIDNIVVSGEKPTAIPACTAFSALTEGAVVNAGSYNFAWPVAADASAYKLTVGTASGGSDIFSGTVIGQSQVVPLAKNTTYYAKLVPTNEVGDATGCTEISFSTNGTISYCTASATATTYEKIASVLFAGTTKTSTSSAGYEDQTSTIMDVEQQRSYTLTVKSTTDAYADDRLVAWIDFNGDGDFDDAGENIVPVTAGVGSGTNWTVTKSISIPADAIVDKTRMRIRLYDMGYAPNSTPCGTTTYGQVEDYTINIKEYLAVSDVNKAGISVFPNPFTDVLKISDVKGVKSVSVNDVSGREVKSLAPAAELNLSSLKAGLYIVNLKMEDGSIKSFKAIKK